MDEVTVRILCKENNLNFVKEDLHSVMTQVKNFGVSTVSISLNTNYEVIACSIYSNKNLIDESIFKKIVHVLAQLENLLFLEICGSYPFKTVPNIGTLQKLVRLRFDISEFVNELEELPSDIGDLKKLKKIYIEAYSLNSLPKSFKKLQNLNRLKMWSNINELPQEVCELKDLRRLEVVGAFCSVPKKINQLQKLKSLTIRSSQSYGSIDNVVPLSLSVNISELKELKFLDIDCSRFSDETLLLLSNLPKLENLIKLKIHNQDLSNLPDNFGNMKNLKSLSLEMNLLNFPVSIGNLRTLEFLYVSSIYEFEFPESFCELSNLLFLDINVKKINNEKFLQSLGKLSKLKTLRMSIEILEEIPLAIGQLLNLEELEIDIYTSGSVEKTFVENIPDFFQGLLNLKICKLWISGFTRLPESFGKLEKLETLNIKSKTLRSLPDTMEQLSNLINLILWCEKLESLPYGLYKLEKLSKTDIKSKSFDTLLSTVVKLRNAEKLKDYLKRLALEEKLPLHEAKVLIVGEGGAGKTTLLRKMEDIKHEVPNQNDKATVGINILREWKFASEEGKKNYSANIWDLGGQEIQYLLHQFFLTENTLYVLVCDNRTQGTNFDYWLSRINNQKEGSELFIILNNKNTDSHLPTNFDSNKYKKYFPDLDINVKMIDFSESNPFTKIKSLITDLQKKIIDLKSFKEEIPKSWAELKYKLKEINENYISIDQFINLAQGFGLSKEDVGRILELFHIIGILVYYKDNASLKTKVFLKPQWLGKALYTPFEDNTIQLKYGKVELSFLEKKWEDAGYNTEERALFTHLLEKDGLDIMFSLDSDKTFKIFPALIPSSMQEPVWNYDENLRRKYEFSQLGLGVMEMLIVQLNEKIIPNSLFRDTFLIEYEDTQAMVVKRNNPYERKDFLEVNIRGKEKNTLLEIIKSALDKTHRNIFRVGLEEKKYIELIGCICQKCTNNKDPYFFERKTIDELKKQMILGIQCYKSGLVLNIQSLETGKFSEHIQAINYNTVHQTTNDGTNIVGTEQTKIIMRG